MSNEASPELHLPLPFLQQLQKLALEGGDVSAVAKALEGLPGMARFAPTVDVGQPIHMLALELGRLIAQQRSPKGQHVFRRSGEVVTVDETTGVMERLGPGRFVGWVEQFCAFRSGGRSNRLREGLTREDAALVLEQDVFRDCLREITAVDGMRVPVKRKGGKLEFLAPGYDEESGVFTCDVLPYPMDWTWEQGQAWLVEHCEQFPWVWPEGDAAGEERSLMGNRSFAVLVFALLGTYCRALFPLGTPRPIVLVIGNQPGTGKTRLVEMALFPVFGTAATTDLPKDDDTMVKTMQTVARTRQPYVFFDDIGGGIYSNALYKFATATSHAGRKMGGNSENFEEPNVTQVFATGNDIKFDGNLARRAMVMELFLATEVRGRQFKRRITARYLATTETRAGFLAACCALVRHYIAQAETLPAEMLVHPSPLESFEEYTGQLSMMMQVAGFNDPLMQPELAGGGAEEEDEMKELLVKVATEAEGDEVFDRKELVKQARELGLIDNLVGLKGDKDPDSNAMKKFGRQLQKHRGREYRDERGRRFRFSHRRQKKGATYPLVFLAAGGGAAGS